MKEWQLKEAKTQFSKVVSDAAKGEEQLIVENNKKLLVVMPYSKYIQLTDIEHDKTPIKPFELE